MKIRHTKTWHELWKHAKEYHCKKRLFILSRRNQPLIRGKPNAWHRTFRLHGWPKGKGLGKDIPVDGQIRWGKTLRWSQAEKLAFEAIRREMA